MTVKRILVSSSEQAHLRRADALCYPETRHAAQLLGNQVCVTVSAGDEIMMPNVRARLAMKGDCTLRKVFDTHQALAILRSKYLDRRQGQS